MKDQAERILCRTGIMRVAFENKYLRFIIRQILGSFFAVEQGSLYKAGVACKGVVIQAGEILQPKGSHRINGRANLSERSSFRFPEVRIYAIANCHLVGPRATPMTEGWKFVTEHTHGIKITVSGTEKTLQPVDMLIDRLKTEPQQLKGGYVSVNSPYAFNYYHWVTDCLPCIRAYEQLPKSIRLIVPKGRAQWQNRYLELLGCQGDSLYEYSRGHLTVETLYVPSWHKPMGQAMPPSPSLVRWLRKRIIPKIRAASRELPEKIFISRVDSKKPRIANEAQLTELFVQLGFAPVVLGEMTVDEQVSTFSQARVIAGTHGAGFTNLIFANRPTVIEIFKDSNFLQYFQPLAEMVGGMHYSYFADETDCGERGVINIARLEAEARKILRE